MWLGTKLGRFWARIFDGEPAGCACNDDATQIWLVRRLFPKWAAGMAWGNVILVRRDQWVHPHVVHLIAHEYRHVLQWRRHGHAFVFLYVAASAWAFLRYGPRQAYRMNRFECDARDHET
ncbi:MAG: hypothetical protein RBU21_03290 [FCB group bacterium]|jgi:hypothetical protein|nr:hypothetical protein [FCB group bacterium]